MISHVAVVCIALSGLMGLPLAPVQEKPVRPVLQLKAGDVFTYDVRIKTTIMGEMLEIQQTQVKTIREVRPNGDVVSGMQTKNSRLKVGGMEQTQPDSDDTIETRSKFGKLLDSKPPVGEPGLTKPDVDRLMSSLSGLLLPDKAVKPKDSWDTQLDNPVKKDQKVVAKTTFEGPETVDGKDLLKFKQTGDADAGGEERFKSELTVWVDPVRFVLVKAEAKVINLPTQYGLLTLNVKIDRAKQK